MRERKHFSCFGWLFYLYFLFFFVPISLPSFFFSFFLFSPFFSPYFASSSFSFSFSSCPSLSCEKLWDCVQFWKSAQLRVKNSGVATGISPFSLLLYRLLLILVLSLKSLHSTWLLLYFRSPALLYLITLPMTSCRAVPLWHKAMLEACHAKYLQGWERRNQRAEDFRKSWSDSSPFLLHRQKWG